MGSERTNGAFNCLFHSNSLSGYLPTQLGGLLPKGEGDSNKQLLLYGNSLSGVVPTTFAGLTNGRLDGCWLLCWRLHLLT